MIASEGGMLWLSRCTCRSLTSSKSRSGPATCRQAVSCRRRIDFRDKYRASRNTVRDAIKRLAGQDRRRPGPDRAPSPPPRSTRSSPCSPETRHAGGEGARYLSEVSATAAECRPRPRQGSKCRRRPRRSPDGSGYHQPRSSSAGTRSVTSRPSMVAADLFLLHGLHQQRCHPAADGGGHRARGRALPGRNVGLEQIGYRDWITVRRPDNNEQRFFRISHDSMVFEIFRTGFDQHKKPMRVTVIVFPTDRNQFIVNVGDDLPDPRYDDGLQDQQPPGS